MYLPSSPDEKEKYLFLDSGRTQLYAVSAASTIILVAGMVLFIKANPYFWAYIIFSLATFIYLAFTYFIGIFGKEFNHNKHKFLLNKHFDKSATEEIDILLPVCGEPIEILANTWIHVKKLQVAHEGKCTVYVLDDKRDVKVASLADRMQFNYIARPTNELKKAGNLRYAFTRTYAPYFIVFDADFCPRKDFILNTMPYFYNDHEVGIVQTPQFFEVAENQTAIQKACASVQELFYRLIQVSRDTFDGSICVGSNAVYSRKHLEKFGGTAAIGYSEDVRTGFRLTAAGEKVRYIPINLAKGTCPENWKQFFTQYYRWSMGSLDLMLSKEFWVAPITKYQRTCYMTGMLYYLTTGLSVLFASAPSIYLLLYKPHLIHWFNLLFSLPSFFLGVFYMKLWQKLPYNLNVLRIRHVASFAHLFALKDCIFNTAEAWVPTGSANSSQRFEAFKFFYACHTLFIPSIILILITTRVVQGYDIKDFALLIFFTTFNLYIATPVIKEL
jgi:cellulose synthase/poly-beta-1,6-N-acetylglucosamine synthase-like glycosyltransferase